jgi:outer membrane protein insertion porin family
MKVPGLILGLLLPWIVQAQQQYYGTRASSVTLAGSESQADLEAIPIHVGDLITLENVRASIQALYSTGRYSTVEADATATPAGTALTFRVRPNFFFSTFRIEPSNLLDRPLSSYFRLPTGEKFTTAALDQIVQRTTDQLMSEGYFQAVVTPDTKFDDETHLVFTTLKVDPGPRATIGQVRIQGGEQTFTLDELADAFDVKPGRDYSASRVDKGVTELRKKFTELRFLNTKVTADRTYNPANNTVDLNLTVQPGQFALVQAKGFDISAKKLRELVPIFEEATVDPDLVEEGRVNVTRYMQREGYFDAVVTAETIEVDPSLGNAIQINYIIDPGAKHQVVDAIITGNQFFETDEIKKRIKTRKAELFSHPAFSADILEEDRRTIEAMYQSAGFEGTIVLANPQDVDHLITVLFQIQEGRRLRIEAIDITGNVRINTDELRMALPISVGDFYTPSDVDQARTALTHIYYLHGYPDARVERKVERIEANNSMRVSFQITEGQKYLIGAIFVAGNTLTKDKVIRRRSKLQEYTPFNPEVILEAQQLLYATGLFSRVEIVSLDQGIPGSRNVLIQVEDAKPILLTYGIGYQEFEHFRGTFSISHNNLFGLNRSISLRTQLSARERLAGLTYREPRLLNHDLDGFVSSFVEHSERPFYSANRIDFSLQVLKKFTAQDSFLVSQSYQTVNIGDQVANPHAVNNPSQLGPCQICQIGWVGTSYVAEHRDDPLNATKGWFSTTTFRVAGPAFGSELSFTSLFNQSVLNRPFRKGTLVTAVRFGWNHPFGSTAQFAPGQNQQLPATERYWAGGSTTLRGFSLDNARPPNNPQLEGGNVMTIANVEYRMPLPRLPTKNFWGALFWDTGNVFPKIGAINLTQFTNTLGAGIRYQTPFGPVRLDFGFNLNPQFNLDGTPEAKMKVFFTLGNPF